MGGSPKATTVTSDSARVATEVGDKKGKAGTEGTRFQILNTKWEGIENNIDDTFRVIKEPIIVPKIMERRGNGKAVAASKNKGTSSGINSVVDQVNEIFHNQFQNATLMIILSAELTWKKGADTCYSGAEHKGEHCSPFNETRDKHRSGKYQSL